MYPDTIHSVVLGELRLTTFDELRSYESVVDLPETKGVAVAFWPPRDGGRSLSEALKVAEAQFTGLMERRNAVVDSCRERIHQQYVTYYPDRTTVTPGELLEGLRLAVVKLYDEDEGCAMIYNAEHNPNFYFDLNIELEMDFSVRQVYFDG